MLVRRPAAGSTVNVLLGPPAEHRAFALLIRVVGSKVRPVNAEFGTWHHGLIARWWAEFNVATAEEQAYFEAAIRKFGEPALDLACGTGRILMPLIAEGFDVDGADISADMIALAGAAAEKRGFHPRLAVQPMHELDLARTYRTIYMCGSFGLGGRRDYDLEALRRAHRHLEPGGALFITNHNLPYDDDEEGWALWLPGHRTGATSEWPVEGNRRTASDADEIETLFRKDEVDPLQQRTTYHIRAWLWHDGQIAKEEEYDLKISIYFVQEVLLMLRQAGFGRSQSRPAIRAGRPRPTTRWSRSSLRNRGHRQPLRRSSSAHLASHSATTSRISSSWMRRGRCSISRETISSTVFWTYHR